jgi:hypothetical protein
MLRHRSLTEDLSGRDELCPLLFHDAFRFPENEDAAVDARIRTRSRAVLRVTDDGQVLLGSIDHSKGNPGCVGRELRRIPLSGGVRAEEVPNMEPEDIDPRAT